MAKRAALSLAPGPKGTVRFIAGGLAGRSSSMADEVPTKNEDIKKLARKNTIQKAATSVSLLCSLMQDQTRVAS